MSYQKCNSISFSPGKRTVSLSLASSNVTPIEYERVVMEADTDEEFILNILSVFRSIFGGYIQFSTATRSQVQEAYFWTLKYIDDNNLSEVSNTWLTGDYDKLLKRNVENRVFVKFLTEAFRKKRRGAYGVLYSRTGPYYWDPVEKIPYPDYSLITEFGRQNQYGDPSSVYGAPGFDYSRDKYRDGLYFLGDFGTASYRAQTINLFDKSKHNTCDRLLIISEDDLDHLMNVVFPRLEPIKKHKEEFKAYNDIHKIVEETNRNV